MRISDWSSDVCSSDLLAGVAAWADTLRNEDPPRFKATSKWHYVNTAPDGGCRYVPARDCPDGNCVVGAIEKQLAILSDRGQPVEARRDALKFVVHFVELGTSVGEGKGVAGRLVHGG